MEIDLREIQALHARFAREPVVIDLEAQVLSRPAPLMLAHEPVSTASLVRRTWSARASIGRGALMAVGSTVLCAAVGMGVAKLYGTAMSARPAHAVPKVAATPPSVASGAQVTTQAASPTLTSEDFDRSSGRGNALAAVDPASLVRQSAPAATPGEAAAAASPIQQRRIQQAAAPAGTPPAPAAGEVKPQPQATATAGAGSPAPAQQATASVSPQPTQPAHHVVRQHATPTRAMQPPAADVKTVEAKSAPSAAHSGDVQLF